MKKVLNFVKGKREEKRYGGASDVVTVRNLSPDGALDEDIRGYDVDLTGKDKTLSKLHKAAWTGNLEKLKGSMRKTDLDMVDKIGRTPLHLASVQGHSNIVWFLISNRAKINVRDHEGKTPLLKSIECKQQECAQLLLERGADVNIPDNFGNSALHLASAQGSNELAASLLRKGAKLECPNRDGECALHLATKGGHKEMAEFLLRYGSEVNLADLEERTPLMLAAKTGNQPLISLFIEYGADCSALDSNGWTAEDYAVLGGHAAVAGELQARSEDLKGCGILPPFHERAVDASDGEEKPSVLDILEEEDIQEKSFKESNGAVASSSEDEDHKTDMELDSPKSMPDMPDIPPPLQPPRSWDIIQAGLTIPKGGVIPRQRSVFPRPSSWHQRSASLAASPWASPVSSPVEPGLPLCHSLQRRHDVKKPRPTSLPVSLPTCTPLTPDPTPAPASSPKLVEEKKEALAVSKDSVSSDWDSEDDSLPLDNIDTKADPKKEKKESPKFERRGRFLLRRTLSIDLADEDSATQQDKESTTATLGRDGTLQGTEEIWECNPTVTNNHKSPGASSSSSEDFFFQRSQGRGNVKHQNTVINANKPAEDDLELDSSPELASKLLAMASSETKESLNLESSPDVEEKILKITNSMTKESLAQSSPDLEEKLLEMSTSIIKQSFDLDSSPEFESKLIELETSVDNDTEVTVVHKPIENPDIDSSPDLETKIIEDIDKEKEPQNKSGIDIPQLLLDNLPDMDSSPELENQKILDISASIIPECSETEMSPENEDKTLENEISEKSENLPKSYKPISEELKKLIVASEPEEKTVKDVSEKEKEEEVQSEQTPVQIVSDEKEKNEDDEKENNPAPPPRKKKIRAVSLSRATTELAPNAFKRSLSLGPSRPDRRPRRQIKETWEGNAIVRAKKYQHDMSNIEVREIDLSDRDSIGTHSDDTSMCYTKSPHAVLKRRLRAVTADRARLEHVLAGFEEQNRRIQYELADALHAARTQREISTQLAKQLAKAQKAQLQALEECQAIQLQLNTSNTELNWLRNLYEEGKSVSPIGEDARLEWEHQHQLEQLRAEKSKVLVEKSKVEQQMTSEIDKLKDDVLKWMKLYESSTRNSSGVTGESQQEKTRMDGLVTSLRSDLEMSLRKQMSLEKELAALKQQQNSKGTNGKDAATNTQSGLNHEAITRELTAEKERSRRGVQQVRKLRAEVQSLRSRVLAAERRSQSSLSSSGGSAAVSPGGTNYLPPPSPEGDSVTALRRQLEELSASVEEERSQRAELERTIAELRGSPQQPGAPRTDDRYRRSLDEEKSRRIAAEKTVVELRAALAVAGSTGGQGEVTRAELDKVRRSYEVALARAKHEAELAAREELSLKLAQVNTFLEEQLQQQSRLEQLRCTSESQLRQDFQQTRGKLLGELAKVQATLKARNDEDRRLRKQLCSSPRSDAVGNRMSDLIAHLSPCHHENPVSPGGRNEHSAVPPLRPAAAVLSMLMPPLVAQQSHAPGGSSGVCGYTNLLRRELEASVRKAAEAADREQPILTSITDPDDEQLAILKKKYFL